MIYDDNKIDNASTNSYPQPRRRRKRNGRRWLFTFVEKEINNREVSIGAEIYNSNEELCASAVGSIILFTKEKFHKLKISSDEFLENFEKNVFQD